MIDIVERLREAQKALAEAAAEIARLRKVLAIEGLSCKVIADIERQQAEIERLRAALQNIIAGNGGECGCAETARRALENKQ